MLSAGICLFFTSKRYFLFKWTDILSCVFLSYGRGRLSKLPQVSVSLCFCANFCYVVIPYSHFRDSGFLNFCSRRRCTDNGTPWSQSIPQSSEVFPGTLSDRSVQLQFEGGFRSWERIFHFGVQDKTGHRLVIVDVLPATCIQLSFVHCLFYEDINPLSRRPSVVV